jgi:hypothetical protein
MGIHLSARANAKEYRTFQFPAEGFFRNAKLLENAVSFRIKENA